jgi:fructose-1,6-bisphosphatase/inositol monophosphatase family enzyme
MLTFGELEAIAIEAASEGARVVHAAAGDLGTVQSKSTPTDPVTSLDIAAERAIRTVLSARAPDSSVLGEEGGATGGTSNVGWVVDPIDGTVNLTYGLPVMSVSVAATIENEVVAGAVVDILRGDVFSAAGGAGARLDGSAIEPSPRTELAASLIGTGFSYLPEGRAAEAGYLARVLPAGRDIRCFGSAALNLCWVGCGRLDGFYQRNMQHWDFAAGQIIAVEAGAAVTRPRPENGQLMVASGPGIHAELVRLVS